MSKKFYTVTSGRLTGVFKDYYDVKKSVDGFSGAEHKGFNSREEAVRFYEKAKGEKPQFHGLRVRKQPKTPQQPKVGTANSPDEKLLIYTDGACLKNPGGPGGLAYCIIKNGKTIHKYSRGYGATTNNRMELKAIWAALYYVDKTLNNGKNTYQKLSVKTDSKYARDVFTKWIKRWKINGFKTKTGDVKNREIIEPMAKLMEKYDVQISWVKGHANNPSNELVDRLARSAARKKPVNIDKGYK